MAWEYIVERFPIGTGEPADLQKKLNDFASQGHELVSIVEANPCQVWIIMRHQRQPAPMDKPITQKY